VGRTGTVLAICLAILGPGCRHQDRSPSEADRVETLQDQNARCREKLQQALLEKDQLDKRLRTLRTAQIAQKIEHRTRVEKIAIGRSSNIYDRNDDGAAETLIVYVHPIDQDGDTIKAFGRVDLQLWDLDRRPAESMIFHTSFDGEDLRKLWSAALFENNYRLTADLSGRIKYTEPLTVKVTFTDYQTGKVFTQQKVIKP